MYFSLFTSQCKWLNPTFWVMLKAVKMADIELEGIRYSADEVKNILR